MGAAAATAAPQTSLISPVPALSHPTPLPGEGLPEGRAQMQLPWQGDDGAQTPFTKGITDGAARRSAAAPATRRRNGGLTDPSPGVPRRGGGVGACKSTEPAPALTNGRASNRPRQPGRGAAGARQHSQPVRETSAPRPLPWSRRGPSPRPQAALPPGRGAGSHAPHGSPHPGVPLPPPRRRL